MLQTKTTTKFNTPLITLGPRLQRINPDTLSINKIYESVAECLKDTNFKLKRPSIVKAIKDNTFYHGHRWAFIDRELDPNIIINLQQTKPTRIQHTGYIAKLNGNKTKILSIYLDKKTTCEYENYKISSLDNPIKNKTIYNNFYYVFYDICEENIKFEFENKFGTPLLYKNGVGQYNTNGELIKEFICKYDCVKQLSMSDKTLTKALNENVIYNNNCYFKHIGSKLTIG